MMRKYTCIGIAGSFLVSVLLLPAVAANSQQGATPSSEPASEQQEQSSAAQPPMRGLPLRQQMVLMQAALSRIATDVQDVSKRREALEGIDELQSRILEAKKTQPPRFGNLDAAAQRNHDDTYRATLCEMLMDVTTLEIAIIRGDEDQVRTSLDALAQMRERGHAQFQPPRQKRDQPTVELHDLVQLSPAQRKAYLGNYEFKDVGFRVTVVERDGALYLETFGGTSERMFAQGDHKFKIAVSPNSEARFDIGADGVAQAIVLDPGGGRPSQRIERVE